MATDAQRISTLLDQGFSADAIAAILDTDLATVSGVQLSGGSLPAGGGSGFVVGAWEEIDATGLYGGSPDPFLVAALSVPYEIEVAVSPNPSTSGGVVINSDDDTQTFLAHISSYDDIPHNVYERCIIPADTAIKLLPGFGDTANWSVNGLRRRTLA